MFKLKPIALIISGSVLLLTGCSTAQLSNVQKNRGNYNVALNQSDNEQFLLNIVRMRFDKSPFFIGVDSITTQTSKKMLADKHNEAMPILFVKNKKDTPPSTIDKSATYTKMPHLDQPFCCK